MVYRHRIAILHGWVEKHPDWIIYGVFAAWIGPSIVVELFWLETEYGSELVPQSIILAIKYFVLPWLVFLAVVFRKLKLSDLKDQLKGTDALEYLFLLVALLSAVLVMPAAGAGYISLVNALTGPQQRMLVTGRVTGLSKSRSEFFVKLIRSDGSEIKFEISRREYDTLKRVDSYQREVQMGGLGLSYRWR